MDFFALHGWIIGELFRNRPVADSMQDLIHQCAARRPHPDWDRLRSLPYGDLESLRRWLETPFREEPLPPLTRGLWFGLYNPCYDGKQPVADIYVCGSERFEPDPANNEWAVGADWEPLSRYARSAVFADIYRIAYGPDQSGDDDPERLCNDAEYPLCLGYGAFAIRELFNRIDSSLILDAANSLGIAVGFDSGDFILIGELTLSGLRPFEPDVERLLEALNSSDDKRVVATISTLKMHGPRAEFAVADLSRIARNFKNPFVRIEATRALKWIVPDQSNTKHLILELLRDSNARLRLAALEVLVSLHNLSDSDIATIRNMSNDPDKRVVREAKNAIQAIQDRFRT